MLLRQLPTRWIVYVLTRSMRRALEQPAHNEHALTSSGVNPTWGLMIVVAARSAAVISALRIVDHLFPLKTALICMFGGALCFRKCATRCQIAATAHARGCPVAPCPIYSPLTPFFCIIKRSLTKVAAAQVEEGGYGGLGGLGYHKELDVAKVEGGGDCICSTRAVFTGSEEEEESDIGEVCDCSSSRQSALDN